MQKKKITAFLLALAMVSAMALPVFAQEQNPPRNRKLTLNRQRTM